jgi:hypothetical protein
MIFHQVWELAMKTLGFSLLAVALWSSAAGAAETPQAIESVVVTGQQAVEIFSTATNQFVTSGGAKLIFTDDGDKLKIDRYEAIQIAAGMPVAGLPQPPK